MALGGDISFEIIQVISIEYNNQFPPESTIAFPDPAWMLTTDDPFAASIWEGPSCYMGSSAGAIYAVAQEHHYVVVNASSGLDLILVRHDLWPWAVPSVAYAAGPPVQWCMKPEAMTPEDFETPETRAFPATLEKAAYWVDYATLQVQAMAQVEVVVASLRILVLFISCGEFSSDGECVNRFIE